MSCSYTVEYAYNDNCLSRVAKLMGDSLTADKMAKRSSEWEKMFNPDLESSGFKGFVAPVGVDGERILIDPTEVFGSWQDYFYEGNAWTYTLFTPADFERLIALCGGKEEMVKRLRYGFDNNLVNLYFSRPVSQCRTGYLLPSSSSFFRGFHHYGEWE